MTCDKDFYICVLCIFFTQYIPIGHVLCDFITHINELATRLRATHINPRKKIKFRLIKGLVKK